MRPTQPGKPGSPRSPPATRAEYERRLKGTLPSGLDAVLDAYKQETGRRRDCVSRRAKASEALLKVLAPAIPELILGSADLTASTNNKVELHAGPRARHLHRPLHPFGACANMAWRPRSTAMNLHGGFIASARDLPGVF